MLMKFYFNLNNLHDYYRSRNHTSKIRIPISRFFNTILVQKKKKKIILMPFGNLLRPQSWPWPPFCNKMIQEM